MNASASALSREGEVRSRIRSISRFSRVAGVVCSAIFGFGLVGGVGVLLLGVLGMFFPKLDHSTFTVQQKIWALPMTAVVAGIALAGAYQLYRLFGNLAAGAIYTPENVRRVRHLGLLWLLLAVLGVLIPLAWSALYAYVFIDPTPATPLDRLSFPETLSSFASAGLILLVSWIMDVGLYEKDHADALQRDADLVI